MSSLKDSPAKSLFEEGLKQHQTGHAAEAEALYRQALALDPAHADSLHLLGILSSQAGRHDAAVEMITQAIALKPDFAGFHTNLGMAYKNTGQLAPAEASFRQAIALGTDNPQSHFNLGGLLDMMGRGDEALACFERMCALDSMSAEARNILGNALQARGRDDEAAAQYKRALFLKPDFAEASNNLGTIYKSQGRLNEAVAQYEQATALNPDFAEAYNNLANVLKELGRGPDAVDRYQRAIALKPDFLSAYNNLGTTLLDLGRIDEAIDIYQRTIALDQSWAVARNNLANAYKAKGDLEASRENYLRAIALDPGMAVAHNNLGTVYRELDRFKDAVESYKQAIRLKPDLGEAYNNFGALLTKYGHLDEAIACYEQAVLIMPGLAVAHANLGGALKEHGLTERAIACYRRSLAIDPKAPVVYNDLLLTMLYDSNITPAELAGTAREYGRNIANPLRRDEPIIRDRHPERKLRIGYVSPDFRSHAVNYFFELALTRHDRGKFEVFGYSNLAYEDSVTLRLKTKFDHWRDISGRSDDDVVRQIEDDEIDILIDLAGHTGHNRLLVFARKRVPVQVTWLGYPATSGMAAMDYRITDNYAEPPGLTEHLNTETLWRLPDMFCCYAPHDNSPGVIDHPPFEDNGYITFGCFNNFTKVTDQVLASWARILARVPESRLLLEIKGITSPPFRAAVDERLRRAGLPLDRVMLEPRRPANQYALYNRIDIALDPFPANGGTTSMDILWMGVPFVTLAGEHFFSRLGVTILTNGGLPELIAADRDQYVDLAVALAQDRGQLRALRHNLRQKVAAGPLMDQEKFTRNLETAYRQMWRRWCAAPEK